MYFVVKNCVIGKIHIDIFFNIIRYRILNRKKKLFEEFTVLTMGENMSKRDDMIAALECREPAGAVPIWEIEFSIEKE